ncbi:amphi-Trp domain-containing protein [Enterococcus pallens]|nr:amphi-Trp domain-containing protein [Enterococcus pallens]OJG81579.1 hypothetical protein RV10_GL002818 [Enterococcus pallens]
MMEQKPVTEVLVDREERQTLVEFATTLETIARKLKEEGAFILTEGEREILVNPSDTLKVEYSYEKKGDKHSFEIEFDWRTGDQAPGKLGIK